MRTQLEYEGILNAEADSVLSRPVGTRRDVQAAGAEARRRVTKKKGDLTKEISQAWRDGFKIIKDENDAMQANLRAAHLEVDRDIFEKLHDMIVLVQR